MKNIILTILLVFVVLADCTNALRRKKTDYQTMNDFLMLTSCAKGMRWINGYYNYGTYSVYWIPGHCKSNSDNCKQFDSTQSNCTECDWGFGLNKKQSTGHFCTMKWWCILLIVIGATLGIMLLFYFICYCCCGMGGKSAEKKAKKDKKKYGDSYDGNHQEFNQNHNQGYNAHYPDQNANYTQGYGNNNAYAPNNAYGNQGGQPGGLPYQGQYGQPIQH